jgi:hypothetical protein
VHVCKTMCTTCVFRPGNLMHLDVGRLAQMVQEACAEESAITCHSTLDGDNAVCFGFFERHATQPLQVAERLGMIEWDDPPHFG